MVALVLAAAYREKFGGDHIDDVRAALAGVRGAHRLEARIALVLVGFMGAGKSTGARSLAAELGAEALDSDRELERRLGEPVESFFDREGEHAFRAREEELVARAARARGRARGGARRRRASARSGCARRSPATPWSTSRSSRTRPGGGRPARAGRWRATAGASSSCTATASRCTSRWPTRVRAAGRPRCAAAGAAGAARPGGGAAGHAARLGVLLVGRVPGLPRARADRGRLLLPGGRPADGRDRRERGARPAVRGRRADRRDAGRGAQVDPRRRVRAARPRPGRRRARRHRGRGGRRGGGRPGRLLRGRLPARDAPRPGADHAGRAGGLGLRREDRSGPAGGQELRGRLPPALGGHMRPGGARDAAARGARRRLPRGREDGADRGRPALVARAPGRRRGRRRDPRLHPHEARRWSPRTSATRAAGRC